MVSSMKARLFRSRYQINFTLFFSQHRDIPNDQEKYLPTSSYVCVQVNEGRSLPASYQKPLQMVA